MCGSLPQILSKDLFEEAQHACSTLKHVHIHSLCVVLECHLQHTCSTLGHLHVDSRELCWSATSKGDSPLDRCLSYLLRN